MTRLILFLIVGLLLGGCSGSSETREAVVPKQETSVRHVAPEDTSILSGLPPADLSGRATRPASVERYPDAQSRAEPSIERVEVTNDSVTVQAETDSGTTRRTYGAPPEGEELNVQSTPGSTDVNATVEGTPKRDTLDVLKEDGHEQPGFFERTERNLAVVGGLAVLLVVGFFLSKLNVFSISSFLPW
jgi:hypothetical protein